MTPPRVLVAPDKFKGSLPAAGVAAAVAYGLREHREDLDVAECPVADGGEGTLDAAVAAGYHRVPVVATGPAGQPVDTAFARLGTRAVVELADVSGLARLPGGRPAPLTAGSTGTGEVIRHALDAGCRDLVVGLGGSACTDGGSGLLRALGARLVDSAGGELPPGGAALADLDRVDLAGLDPRLRDATLTVASDVDNPLHGADGAAAVYGPQKGATPWQVALLDAALTRWADRVTAALGTEGAHRPGAGAAGGAGYALLSVLGGHFRPGIDTVLELVGFHTLVPGAALVVTGEGALDEQTLRGKGPAGVARVARSHGVPVVAVAGRSDLSRESLAAAGILGVYTLTDLEPDLAVCIAEPVPLLRRIGAAIGADRLSGVRPPG
ncbi:glycerate kinase [Amycolatopsis antarctica]|uniref:Glycerate kinase n=1 Tax=Amycolatopsis antarctica TaxID=1854586 RepID=A0A263D0L8_9PSEU|nr:glycerate kinase [Amycolatopsis antarctica]OZM71759.1 glycerate kinase [Amycolatopsis antarctica]